MPWQLFGLFSMHHLVLWASNPFVLCAIYQLQHQQSHTWVLWWIKIRINLRDFLSPLVDEIYHSVMGLQDAKENLTTIIV